MHDVLFVTRIVMREEAPKVFLGMTVRPMDIWDRRRVACIEPIAGMFSSLIQT